MRVELRRISRARPAASALGGRRARAGRASKPSISSGISTLRARGAPGQQVELLEHHGAVGGRAVDPLAVDDAPSPCDRPDQPVGDAQQRGLAATAGPEETTRRCRARWSSDMSRKTQCSPLPSRADSNGRRPVDLDHAVWSCSPRREPTLERAQHRVEGDAGGGQDARRRRRPARCRTCRRPGRSDSRDPLLEA